MEFGARAANHLVGDVEADDLPWPLASADHLRQQPAGPSCAAAQVEHFLARLQAHQRQRLLGDADVMVLHLFALAGFGPLVKLAPHLFVGGKCVVFGHCVLSALSSWLLAPSNRGPAQFHTSRGT